MSPKLIRGLAAFALALGPVAVFTEPAVAAPVCDVPEPPPVCGGDVDEDNAWVNLTSASRVPTGVQVKGSAGDPDATTSVQVIAKISGVEVGRFSVASGSAFIRTLPARYGDTVCLTAVNQGAGVGETACRTLAVRFDPFGSFDELAPGPSGLRVRGWVIDPDTASPLTVSVRVNGRLHTALVASTTRTDVAASYPAYGGDHGFDLLVPAARGDHTVCVTALNAGVGVDTALPCRTVTQGGAPVIDHFLVRAPDYPTPRMEVDVRVGTRDATQVSVWRGPTPNGPWTDWPTPHSTWSNPAGYWEMDLTVDWGRTYCYLATAYNAYGSHTPPAVCATTWAGAYPQPARVGATGVSDTSMMLSWDDVAMGEAEWRLVRSGVPDVVLAGTPGTGRMSHLVTGLQPGTQYCFLLGARSPGWAGNPYFFCQWTAKAAADPTTSQGVAAMNLWNCDPRGRAGTVWSTDANGRWVLQGALPNSLVAGACGPATSAPAARVTLPGGRTTTLAVVVVDGRYCVADDPYDANCRVWQTPPTLGDPKGITENRLLLG
ncbi:fibronectin type III domain-containing protein [Micromonospora harpali]|uniref:Fibronectin type-III domain-containing protein n=1 Tax=Micromonospora harpali TaxID=1490225 RepID=A0ABW1HIE4_9ACTN